MLKNIIIGSFGYGLIRYLASAVALFKLFLIAKYLGPELLGIYSVIILLTEFLNYMNLGIFFSMTRDIAILIEKNKSFKTIKLVMGSSLSFALFSSSILLLVIVLMISVPNINLNSQVIDYLPHLAILVISYQLKHFTQRYLQLYDHFLLIGSLEFLAQLTNTLIILFFIDEYLIDAVLFSIIISNLILAIVGLILTPNISLSFNLKIIKDLIISGLPILFYNVFILILTSIDRGIIAFYYQQDIALGYFQLGYALSLGLFTGFRAVAFLVQPRIFRLLKEENHNKNIYEKIKRQTDYLEVCLVLLALIGIIFVPYLINIFLSEYNISIRITQFLLMGLTLYGINYFHSSYLIANNKEGWMVPALVIAVTIAIMTNIYSIKYGYGLYGIAFGKVIAFGSYGLMIQYLICSYLNLSFFKSYIQSYYRIALLFIPLSIVVYKELNIIYPAILFLILYFSLLKKVYFNILLKYMKFFVSGNNHG